MSRDRENRQRYLNDHFRYDHPFNRQYDQTVREQRQYVDLQPAITPQAGRLLAFLIRLMNAKRVLELGTSIGYSAHWLASALETTDGKLITVDNHPRTVKEAKTRFENSGLSDRIELIQSDVEKVIPTLARPFDLIFVDCGKAFYPSILKELYPLLKVGGVLAVDDTLFALEPQAREGLVQKVEEFNRLLNEDPRFYSLMLDIGHGLTLAVKQELK